MNFIIDFTNTLYPYNTAFDVMENHMDPAAFEALSDDEKAVLESLDDYEYFLYIVLDGKVVYIVDGREGGSIIGRQSLNDFVSDTLEYIRNYQE